LTGLYRRLESESRNPLTRAYVHLQWRKMAAMEPCILRLAQRVFVCSEPERAQLRVWGIDRARVVPNGVDLECNQPQARPTDGRQRLVFCGGMDYLPNQDGVRWFLDSIWPELVRTQPDLELLIVGKNPPRDLTERAEAMVRSSVGFAVRFTGRVEDVRPLVSSADLSIVPLRIGGGTRLKILESLALGRAVVSTSTGAEGLQLEAGAEIAIADEPQAFATLIRELLADPARRERMAQAGRARVLAQYGWQRTTAAAFD
jgi:glycosyltransferase involved in cell wall biosynthesis